MTANPTHATLTPNTPTTITLDTDYGEVEITNRDGAAEIWVTTNGTDPVMGQAGVQVVPAAVGASNFDVDYDGPTVVKLLSASAVKVSVRGL